jgi:hypothetical protein
MRCIECGRSREQHGEDDTCPGQNLQNPRWSGRARFASMDLPTGKTCDDCRHFGFCSKFIGPEIAGNTHCDWFPIRFLPATIAGAAA